MIRKIFTSLLIFSVLFISAWIADNRITREFNLPEENRDTSGELIEIMPINRVFGDEEIRGDQSFQPREYVRVKPIM